MQLSGTWLGPRGLARGRVVAVVAAAGLALAACGGSGNGDSNKAGSGTAKTDLTLAWVTSTTGVAVWTLDQCKDPNVNVKLVRFNQYADAQRAISSGDADMVSMGYQNLAQLIKAGFTDIKLVAGVYRGGEHITVRNGVVIKDWKGLAGKKVGIPPNSFVDMLFRAGATENGLNYDDVNVIPFPGAGPAMISALQRGDIDVMVAWEPNNLKAAALGIGYYPTFDLQQGATGDATEALYASDKTIKNSPAAVQGVVKCLVERTKFYNDNHADWEKALVQSAGLNEAQAKIAVTKGLPDNKLPLKDAQNIIKIFAENGAFPDYSKDLAKYFNYTFLAKATGQTPTELGGQ